MQDDTLAIQNANLTRMLKQAGLDAEAQAVAARIQSVLIKEIHHRTKNMLALVTSIVRQSMRSATTIAGAEGAINSRLVAMAKAHDLLLEANLESVGLASIVRGAIEQHNTASGRISLNGEDIEIIPSSVLPLTLILHELCTNATKYGALSNDGGSVRLTWASDSEGKTLSIRWIEKNGPPVNPPGGRSFGTRLIEDAIPRQLGGTGRLAFPATGVEFELVVPFEKLKSPNID